ncbi:2OG-Fe(II) oxygenase superfamily protein [Yamadazyma tenuis]|uniref:Clavaminate synthase-like protein n=1 Tax=Candida tenuis (strain ATCC 10573 / BCRC 21748 / CBS 615 / JCM 9827 / NBRC 10315 / NRRL Y-1498 / VKM Y-70) TaxID=590646 RepID=G3B315_CANTC|nr:Clavaminate synthase-like protein [Yamadazyma tenuis ATCC 10573]EGV64056.1 Clavaminate synthase-like protein [Yamadazyma tenuis ATCC 10573]WEJ96314.1 2OG-Fe(II) oxygenase superfamily protein [Yamadazyma tenuis]
MTIEWNPPAATKEQLSHAELTVLDLSKYDEANGKYELAQELKTAVSKDGFWSIIGHGISPEEVSRQFALSKHFFDDYTVAEKSAQTVDFEKGDYFGYKSAGVKRVFGTQVKDTTEVFNIPKFNGQYESYYKQDFIKQHRKELDDFSKKSYEVGKKLLTLFAIILEIDEEYFVNNHLYNDRSDDHLRYMKYSIRSAEDDKQVENIYARAHTDFGSLTLLFEQRVEGLQIKLSDGSWKYVKPVENGIVCNIGDALTFWSNGYFKSTIHRVVRPPEDQVSQPRYGLFYFFRPGDKSVVQIVDSPVLRSQGLYKASEPLNGTEYVRKRVENYHNRNDYPKQANVKFKVGSYEVVDGFD